MSEPRPSLAAWQWALYADNHTDRRNLLLHVVTVPFFWAGAFSVLVAPFTTWLNLFGAVVMVAVVALQGRTHALESVKPVPFRSKLDVVARIFTEQFFTFPRFVLSGGFGKAWRAAGTAR